MKIFNFFSILLLTLFAVSCGTDDPAKNTLKVDFYDNVAFITAAQDTFFADCPTMHFEFDNDNNLADVRVEFQNTTFRSFNLEKVPYEADQHGVCSAVHTFNDGGQFSSVKIAYFPVHDYDGVEVAGYALQLQESDGTKMSFFPRHASCHGATETTNTTSADKFVSTAMYFNIELPRPDNNSIGAATVTIEKAQFMAQMPTVGSMKLYTSNVDTNEATLTPVFGHEGYTISAPIIIPSIASTPYPQYSITNFALDTKPFDNQSEIQFNCMKVFKVDAVVGASTTESFKIDKQK